MAPAVLESFTLVWIVWRYIWFCAKWSPIAEVLFFFFHSKKITTEAHRELQKVYEDAALSDTRCRDWFRRFKDCDLDVDDSPREGHKP